MTTEKTNWGRRKLLVLGATSVFPACSAGGADPSFWDPGGPPAPPGGNGGSSTTGTTGTTGSSGHTSSSTSSSSGHTSSSTSSSSGTTSSSTSSSSTTSTSGGPTCPSPANSHRLNFTSYPQLNNAGGSVGFKGSGYQDPACGQPDIIVVAKGGGQFLAFSASCGHQCCIVKYQNSEFHCPCHGANFNATTGACTNGISGSPLTPLMVCSDSTGVTVTW